MTEYNYYGAYSDSDGISPYHKIWISQTASNGDTVTVAGYLGEGTSREIVSNWEAPFADSTLAAKYAVASGALTMLTGRTTLSTLNSRQVWAGNQPYTYNLVMKFRAFSDPAVEVEKAIEALELMMAPDLKEYTPWGRVPLKVSINCGRKQILTDCCIKSMSTPLDKERNADGYLIRADVSLQVETIQTVTKTDLTNSLLS